MSKFTHPFAACCSTSLVMSHHKKCMTANQGWDESPHYSNSYRSVLHPSDPYSPPPPGSVRAVSLTWAPEGDALLLVCLADAVVAVAIHAVAGVPIVQVNIGRALRAGPRAELGQIAGIARLSAGNPRCLQLQNKQNIKGRAVPGSAMQHRSRFPHWPGPS